MTGRLRKLIEDFVGFDHAEIIAGVVFDGLIAGLQVLDFGDEGLVALAPLLVDGGFLRQLVAHAQPAQDASGSYPYFVLENE